MGSRASFGPLVVCAALLVISGCPAAHGLDAATTRDGGVDAASIDASTFDAWVADARPTDAPIDAPSCAPMTPLGDFDAFVAAYIAHYLAQPHLDYWGAHTLADRWIYARARVASGAARLDPELAEQCVLAAAWRGSEVACERAVQPRCAAPVGTPCGARLDCDPGLVCAAAGYQRCALEGYCAVPIPIGEPCEVSGAPCADPSPGFTRSYCSARDATLGSARCYDVRDVEVGVGEPADEFRPGPDETSLEVTTCSADLMVDLDTHDCVEASGATGERYTRCDLNHPCDDGLRCWQGGCYLPEDIAGCDRVDRDSDCALFEGAACVGLTCTPTDGTRGAPCDPVRYEFSFARDCAPGLMCGDDHRCTDRLPLGAVCAGRDADCETACCSRDSSALERTCVAIGER